MTSSLYITGIGIISALGRGCEATLDALRAERSGIGGVRYLGTTRTDLPVAEVPASNEELASLLQLPVDRPTTRSILLGTEALREAVEAARLTKADIGRADFVCGSTVGGMDMSEQFYRDFLSGDSHREYIDLHDVGANSTCIADTVGRFSSVTSLSTACSSAANAIIHAAFLIRSGESDMVVAGGTECLTKFHLGGFNSLLILDHEPCRPFCETRAGLNLGEGAAFLVIESEKSVVRRGVTPIARLSGIGNACDAFHQTATSPEGEGAARAMLEAIADAHLRPEDIGYVNAHGTGTPDNDRSEAAAMRRVFGASIPPYSSTKAFTGHTTSASGSIESVICLLALRHGFLPANLHFRTPIEGMPAPVLHTTPSTDLKHVLCNSFGFGGNDSSLIFSRL